MRFFKILFLFCFVLLALQASAQSEANPDTITTASGLRYFYLVKAPEGAPKAAIGKKLKLHYIGRFTNGTIFETSLTYGDPMRVKLGDGSVIKGWEEVLQLMAQGDKVTVIIPPNLGYADKGLLYPDDKTAYLIPPGTTLVFELDLLSVK